MKLAFISDIHGNCTALDAVLEDIRGREADEIYILGDLCYRGPEPKKSLDTVRSLHAQVIKGNADEWVVRGVRQGEVPDSALGLMNEEREWTLSQLNEEDLGYLKELPESLHLQKDGVSIEAFHATPDSLFAIVPPGAAEEELQAKLMKSAAADLYVYAHIHKPYIRYLDGRAVINTGSVGLPFDGLPLASYAMVEIGRGGIHASIHRVAYDIEEVIRQYEAGEYPNRAMMAGILRSGRIQAG
ncbi:MULTISPECIES: metallophosphoesterase family protein [Paenibacillus]|uniref:metallophosphoesterase family protein n=1 Tax=Paenibacillus TaxID=44249 RepID=UPI0022B85FFF|nr:metallophosphoesterase family protein [Paenibacillus caseinilyticus]MCZ8521913.1 metallophosphoesterase family protein [Paenibacillus caseinilyticus]